MSKKRLFAIVMIALLLCSSVFTVGCSQSSAGLQDGYYTAEDKNGHFGWYEFLTIYVKDGKIVSSEYNAKNSAGFIKSWDMNYMRTMNAVDGTYPNEYTRNYASQLIETQSSDDIDALTGATSSYNTFTQLAEAVLQKAETGDKTVAIVDVHHEEE